MKKKPPKETKETKKLENEINSLEKKIRLAETEAETLRVGYSLNCINTARGGLPVPDVLGKIEYETALIKEMYKQRKLKKELLQLIITNKIETK